VDAKVRESDVAGTSEQIGVDTSTLY
jgi:hypothetical protein